MIIFKFKVQNSNKLMRTLNTKTLNLKCTFILVTSESSLEYAKVDSPAPTFIDWVDTYRGFIIRPEVQTRVNYPIRLVVFRWHLWHSMASKRVFRSWDICHTNAVVDIKTVKTFRSLLKKCPRCHIATQVTFVTSILLNTFEFVPEVISD